MTSLVGALTLPVPAGASNARIVDPTVDGLLDYLAFSLKDALDAKLATLTGTSADACPTGTAHRIPYNPDDPRADHVKLRPPALFVWWDGRAEDAGERFNTLVYEHIQRDIQVLYVFGELPKVVDLERRAHLLWNATAALRKAIERGRHADYAYASGVLGTPIWAPLKLVALSWVSASPGRWGISDAAGKSKAGGTSIAADGRDYPALRVVLRVVERVGADIPTDPGDVAGDILVDLETNELGDMDDTVDVLSGYLPAPDGSDD